MVIVFKFSHGEQWSLDPEAMAGTSVSSSWNHLEIPSKTHPTAFRLPCPTGAQLIREISNPLNHSIWITYKKWKMNRYRTVKISVCNVAYIPKCLHILIGVIHWQTMISCFDRLQIISLLDYSTLAVKWGMAIHNTCWLHFCTHLCK